MKLLKTLAPAALLLALPSMGLAQDAEAAAPGFDEIGPYIMTTLLFCMAGFLVFFMAAALPCSKAAWCGPRTSPCR